MASIYICLIINPSFYVAPFGGNGWDNGHGGFDNGFSNGHFAGGNGFDSLDNGLGAIVAGGAGQAPLKKGNL